MCWAGIAVRCKGIVGKQKLTTTLKRGTCQLNTELGTEQLPGREMDRRVKRVLL